MEEVLRSKLVFSLFVKHCGKEFNVESVLFMVEVAQFKATLVKYHIPPKSSQYIHLNPISELFIVAFDNDTDDIPAENHAQKNKKERELSDSPVPEQALELFQINVVSPSNQTTLPEPTLQSLNECEMERLPKTASKITKLSDIFNKRKPQSETHKTNRKFQSSILRRSWLPVSYHLSLNRLKYDDEPMLTNYAEEVRSTTKTITYSHEKPPLNDQTSEIQIHGGHQLKLMELPSLQPYGSRSQSKSPSVYSEQLQDPYKQSSGSPAIEKEYSKVWKLKKQLSFVEESKEKEEEVEEEEEEEKEEEKSKVNKRTQKVSVEWIYDYAKQIYDKYVSRNAELLINISYETSNSLHTMFYEKTSHNNMILQNNELLPIQRIEQVILNMLSSRQLENKNLNALTSLYLYHIFDMAYDEVWQLLRADSYIRFTLTDDYAHFKMKFDESRKSELQVNK